MIKKKDEFMDKNIRDTNFTDNSFTRAVKKASGEGDSPIEKSEGDQKEEEPPKIALKASDELMRAKESKNDTSVEGKKFRRDEE